jgi:transposase
MKVTTLGIDLAKSIFRLHGVDARGVAVLPRQLTRQQLLPFVAKLSPYLVGIETGPGAHFWAREIGKLGHVVRLMSPHFVKPYVKSNKNDANDAEAICEAVGRPSMRFVPNKTTAQQDVQALHRIRAQLNQVAHGAGQRDPRPAGRVWDRGGRTGLLGISKRGDRYLRTLLIHGARSAVRTVEGRKDPRSVSISRLKDRQGPNVAAVALANRNARVPWALLTKGGSYRLAPFSARIPQVG